MYKNESLCNFNDKYNVENNSILEIKKIKNKEKFNLYNDKKIKKYFNLFSDENLKSENILSLKCIKKKYDNLKDNSDITSPSFDEKLLNNIKVNETNIPSILSNSDIKIKPHNKNEDTEKSIISNFNEIFDKINSQRINKNISENSINFNPKVEKDLNLNEKKIPMNDDYFFYLKDYKNYEFTYESSENLNKIKKNSFFFMFDNFILKKDLIESDIKTMDMKMVIFKKELSDLVKKQYKNEINIKRFIDYLSFISKCLDDLNNKNFQEEKLMKKNLILMCLKINIDIKYEIFNLVKEFSNINNITNLNSQYRDLIFNFYLESKFINFIDFNNKNISNLNKEIFLLKIQILKDLKISTKKIQNTIIN